MKFKSFNFRVWGPKVLGCANEEQIRMVTPPTVIPLHRNSCQTRKPINPKPTLNPKTLNCSRVRGCATGGGQKGQGPGLRKQGAGKIEQPNLSGCGGSNSIHIATCAAGCVGAPSPHDICCRGAARSPKP